MRFWIIVISGLLLAFAASVALHRLLGWDGFFISLASNIVSIIITVAILDRVLARYRAQEWSGADARIRVRLQIFVNVAVSEMRLGLGFGYDIIDSRLDQTNTDAMHQEIVRIARHVLEPAAQPKVEHLDAAGWKNVADRLLRISAYSERIFELYGSRLSPRQHELMLDIQEAAFNATTMYTTFPDVAGVAPANLPKTKTPAAELQKYICDSTAEGIRKVLSLAAELSGTL